MALAGVGRFWEVLRRVDRLFENVGKLQDGQEAITDRLLTIEKRLSALENREELMIERMGTRASEAATAVVNLNVSDMARRLGVLEERSLVVGRSKKKIE